MASYMAIDDIVKGRFVQSFFKALSRSQCLELGLIDSTPLYLVIFKVEIP